MQILYKNQSTKFILILLFLIFHYSFFITPCTAQNKMGYTWIVGFNGSYAKFDGTTARPQVGSFFNPQSPNFPYNFEGGHSCISDCATGNLLFACNSMTIYNAQGEIMDNGNNLTPNEIYSTSSGSSQYTQGSLILPKGNNGEYYVFVSTITDSSYNKYWCCLINGVLIIPNDLLLYNVVDMKANGGAGKVTSKNVPLLAGVLQSMVGMQACRHANGTDWWLLKQGLDSNIIYRFLVTATGITGPYIQKLAQPNFGYRTDYGQSAFSKDGTKYAYVQFFQC